MTPWSVIAAGPKGIDYDRVLNTFKAEMVNESIRRRLYELTVTRAAHVGQPAPKLHHFFTRSIVLSHRDLSKGLQGAETSGQPGKHAAYLYTGRGPSADCLHVGHVIPFLLTKYMQDALGLPLVVQISDDEKFLFRGLPFVGEQADAMISSNIKDIIAFGFNPQTTFIFRNTEYMGEMYQTVLPLQRALTCSAVKNTLGLQHGDSVGKYAFPATQAAPCFSAAFKRVLQTDRPMRCIVPCAIDQDPFFVLTRHAAHRLKYMPPALLHTKFLPALKGMTHKMSSSAEENGVISLHDTDSQIQKKMRRAFSGGRATIEEMKKLGADIDADVAYQFIRFFSTDDDLFRSVTEKYSSGEMNSGQVKDMAAEVLVRDVLADWRRRRALVTDEDVAQFCSIRNILV